MAKGKPLDYFYRMLVEGKLKFQDLVSLYVTFLENKKQEQREDIVEASVLISVFENPKLWQGTKEELKRKIRAFLDKTQVFGKL